MEETAVAAVQRMQDYIDGHLREEITLLQLARAAGYSPYHSAHLFRQLTGKSPFEYIRLTRLSQAALRLRDTDEPVLDVALDFVFDSHEGFTRAFTRAFGLPPARYRKHPPPIQLFIPYDVMAQALLKKRKEEPLVKETKLMPVFVQVIERPARKLMLKRAPSAGEYWAYCQEVGCDIWPMLCSVKEALYEPIGLWLPQHLRTAGTGEYAQGVELPLDYQGEVPEGFELIDLPAAQMMIFQGPAYDDKDFEEAVGQVMAYIDQFDPKTYGFTWAPESAPRFQLSPEGYRGYIEGRPVKVRK